MGTRKIGIGFENVYAAAAIWVNRALEADDSLFVPGQSIWSKSLLQELRERFLDRPDYGIGSFYGKLSQQLEDSPPEVYQLMAEVLYVQFLIVWDTGMRGATKRSQVEEVLSWGAPVRVVPDLLVEGLAQGIARRQALTQYRPYQVAFIIEFAEHWKDLAEAERARLLHDPWSFKEFLVNIHFRGQLLRESPNTARAQREAILHLVHPDHFEGTVSVQQKEAIAQAPAFARFLQGDTHDVDRRLEQIRLGFEKELGHDFDFYDRDARSTDIRARWDPESDPWDQFMRQAETYIASGRLEGDELDYKLEMADG